MITYSCGCANTTDPATGVLRAVSKCGFHVAESGKGGIAHYEELGAIIDGVPQCDRYEAQLIDALPELSLLKVQDGHAMEIGCGASMYAPFLMRAGFDYLGVDPDDEAARWTNQTFSVPTIGLTFEACGPLDAVDLILAAHSLEHVTDAPAVLKKMFSLLKSGGHLVVIVPDDSDPVNPDHLWFFTVETLRALLESTGFVEITTAVRRHIARENFIYCHARKP